MSRKATILAMLLLVLAGVGGVVATRLHAHIQTAPERAARGALVAETRSGPIE
jgi:hypothetical protein